MNGQGDLRRTLRLFRRFAAGQRGALAAAMALLALEASAAVYQPTLLGALINFLKDRRRWSLAGFAPQPGATIQLLAVAIILVTAVNSLADSLAEIALARGGRTIGFNLRVALFGHLQKLSLAFHLRRRTGDVLTRITGDVQVLEEFVVDSVSDLAGSLLLLAGTLGWLLYKSVKVALLALIIVPLLAVVSSFFARRIKAASKVLRSREGDLASTAQEMLTSIGVVQIYGRGEYEQRRFARQSQSAMDAVLRTARLEAAFSFTVSVLEAGVIAAVVWIGALLLHPAISAGLLVTFILQIQNMFKPTRRIIKEWNTVGKIYASVERISELLDRKPAVYDRVDAVPAPPLSGAIEFRDVSFAYEPGPDQLADEAPSALALNGLSFEVTAGDVVALVGHSGAGKSTIAQLVPRLYDPHAGAVLVDGEDVRNYTIESLRSQIAMVLQETVLFSGTVADNIAYGRARATREEIIHAAKQAHAHDFIMALPNGYDTMLGERAATLSGGQRQRLAIARGFIRDARILILDEPTTGLDAESARGVLEALRTLVRGRSALIVSHDFKLIRSVDRILVLSGGRILEEGTPADLLARGGLYAELYAREFGEALAVGAPAVEATRQPLTEHEPAAPGRHRAASRPFAGVLSTAVPQPASPETFRALTGRAPRRGVRPLEDGDLDPMLSPTLNRVVPGLAEALDAEAMAPRLRAMLADGWRLEWCTPGRAIVKPAEGVCLLYRLGVRDIRSGLVMEQVVSGRLLPAAESPEDWMGQHVTPLVNQVAGRADVAAFDRLAMVVRPLRLVLHAFPIDPARPGLMAATDTAHIGSVVAAVLGDTFEGLSLAGCRPEIVRYDRDRCVLRYEVRWRLAGTGRTVKQVLYGKAYEDEQGARVEPAVEAVRAHLQSGSSGASPFLTPRFRGYLGGLRLVLLDAVPGTPQLSKLVRELAAGTSQPHVMAGELARCAKIAATLHEVGPCTGTSRGLLEERDALRAEIDGIAPLAPALADSLLTSLDSLRAHVDQAPLAPSFGHGDFTPGQFLSDGPLRSLVDFDTTCDAEPALDLGRFTGQLLVTACKAAGASDQAGELAWSLGERFLSDYLNAAGPVDPACVRARTSAYRTVSLARIAVNGWRRLKPAQVLVAQRLIADQAPGACALDR